MKVASIDIGTNSMRLLLTDYNKSFKERKKYVDTTRLGKGVDKNGYISEESMNKNLDSLNKFVIQAKESEAEKIFAIGTSALRDSKNKDEFVNKAKQLTGIEVEIIDGNLEADLGFFGVSMGVESKGRILIVDIGGGSTELVIGSKAEGILYRQSLDIGAVRLTEKFNVDDVDTQVKLASMQKYIASVLEPIKDLIKMHEVSEIIGIGGTITSASSIKQEMKSYDTNLVHNSVLSYIDIDVMLKMLSSLTLCDRKKVLGLQPGRADIILSGLNILLQILKDFDANEIVVSEYDNLEGLIYYKLSEGKQ